jgi:hypothetical protein
MRRLYPGENYWERPMRAFLGMILGVLLTISVVYIHDHIASGSSSLPRK